MVPPAPVGATRWDLETLREVLTDAHPDWAGEAIEATLANLQQLPDGSLRPWLTRERHRARVAALLADRPRELYAGVGCRTVLLAAGDPPEAAVTEAVEALPEAALTVFAGGDHDQQRQYPAEVAAAITGLG